MHKWMMITAFLATLLALGGCASSGQASGDEAVAEAEGETEVVCRRVKKVGSNFYHKVCKTRRQMDEEKSDSDAVLRRQRERNARGAIQNSGVGGG